MTPLRIRTRVKRFLRFQMLQARQHPAIGTALCPEHSPPGPCVGWADSHRCFTSQLSAHLPQGAFHSPSQGHLGWGTHHSMWSCQDRNAGGAPPPTNVIPIVVITQPGTGACDPCVASEILSSGTHQTKDMAEGSVLFCFVLILLAQTRFFCR